MGKEKGKEEERGVWEEGENDRSSVAVKRAEKECL